MNCHPTLCGMQVTLQGNAVLSVAGDPDNPDSRGFLCMRGRAAREIIGNEGRILYPRVRDDRASDKWRTIDWAEALDRMSEKLGSIAPEAFGIWLGHGDAATNYGTRIGGLLSRRFAHLRGAQWWHPAMICWGLGGFGAGLTGVLDVHTKEDLSAHADLVLLWGANIASQPNTAPHLKAARARGARVIVIDVRGSEATARADDVLRLRPGSDPALALGLMHVLVAEDLVNTDFVAAHTVGYAALARHLQRYDPQWAEAMTGVAATTIASLAREYAKTRRAMIVMGGSSMHKSAHGWQAARAITCLPALTGKLGIRGGGLGPRHGAAAHGQALNSIMPEQGNRCRAVIPNQMAAMTEAFRAGKIKALLLSGTDMLSSFADANALRSGLDQVELIVSHDLFPNQTIREVADMVLPATAWLEQLGCKMTNTHLYLMDKVIPAPGQTRNLSAILRSLADRLGVGDFFPWPDDEGLIDAILDHPATGYATVAALREEGGMRAVPISHHAYPDHRYATPSGKVEFFSAQAQALGLAALPIYEPLGAQDGYPLQFRQGRTLTHFHGFYDHGQALPTLRKRGGEPTLWLAREDAEARGIPHGSEVRVFNQRGEFTATANVTDKIGSGTVWMRDGWTGVNKVTAGGPCLPDSAVDLFPFSAGQAAFDATVEVASVQASPIAQVVTGP